MSDNFTGNEISQREKHSDKSESSNLLSREAELSGAPAVHDDASSALTPRYQIVGDRALMLASEHSQPGGTPDGDVDPASTMSVTLYLKSKASNAEIQQTLKSIARGEQADYSENPKGFADKFGADPIAVAQVEKFAASNGLSISDEDVASGRVVLQGSSSKVANAFGTRLITLKGADGASFISHQGHISIPAEMAKNIMGVFGLDKRPAASPHFDLPKSPDGNHIGPRDDGFMGYMPQDIAKMYDFPLSGGGEGQGVAIVELDGGINLKDNAQYYAEHNLPLPKINVIEIDGGKNKGGVQPDGADIEVSLDSQVIGAVAGKATQNLIFTSVDDQGFIDGITRATFQPAGEAPNTAISVSWGKPEIGYSADAIVTMQAAIQKAVLKGINVYVAAGDQGGHDGGATDFQVDLPAAIPEAVAIGGTSIVVKDGKISNETVWNSGLGQSGTPRAGGGGISQLFGVPDYQKDITMPPNANGPSGDEVPPVTTPGRGVPDIALDSDPQSGYSIRVDGTEMFAGGTSAAAPLAAALNALISSELGHNPGWLNPKLYQFGKTNPEVFNDIIQGDNVGYSAGPAWDAASGWGSVKGSALLNALRAGNPTAEPPGGK